MPRSLFQNSSNLSYVDTAYDTVTETTPNAKKQTGNNKLAVSAFILACFSFLFAITVVFPVIAGAVSVAAITVAARTGARRSLAWISLGMSVFFAVSGGFLLGWLLSLYSTEEVVRPPANYSVSSEAEVGYKVSPIATIPCDNSGVCPVTIDYFVFGDKCSDGGEIKLVGVSGSNQTYTDETSVPLPPSAKEDRGTLNTSFQSAPNDILFLNNEPTVTC